MVAWTELVDVTFASAFYPLIVYIPCVLVLSLPKSGRWSTMLGAKYMFAQSAHVPLLVYVQTVSIR